VNVLIAASRLNAAPFPHRPCSKFDSACAKLTLVKHRHQERFDGDDAPTTSRSRGQASSVLSARCAAMV
jgi:hypothetical protein